MVPAVLPHAARSRHHNGHACQRKYQYLVLPPYALHLSDLPFNGANGDKAAVIAALDKNDLLEVEFAISYFFGDNFGLLKTYYV